MRVDTGLGGKTIRRVISYLELLGAFRRALGQNYDNKAPGPQSGCTSGCHGDAQTTARQTEAEKLRAAIGPLRNVDVMYI